jgi:serine/threonine protein kinase/Tol biopolymer transport system component
MTLERGTQLHKRYRIVEILGQGGMGSVYRAVDENLGVDVAVKENLFTSDEYSRQFRLEAVILAGLRHPNLPRVSDHFAAGDQGQYLVMDFIEGEDLRQRMERLGTISEEDAVMVGAAMCDALTYLHTRKPSILHRDIKPGNVKISPDGSIYLVDFGLAKIVEGPQATTTGARAMTPGYSPPEQYGTARTDARTDIYSLGATLYAGLTGMIPEDGLARAMDNAQLTPLRRRNPKVSRRVAAAIEKAMAVDPSDRFQTAEEFKRALLTAVSKTERPTGEFTVTPPPEIPHPTTPATPAPISDHARPGGTVSPALPTDAAQALAGIQKLRRPNSLWLTLLFALIIAASGLVILLPEMIPANIRARVPLLFSSLPPPRTPTPAGLLISTPASAAVNTVQTATLAPRMTPETGGPTSTSVPSIVLTVIAAQTQMVVRPPANSAASEIAFVSNRSGIPQVYLGDISGHAVFPITNVPDGACQPSWSPDGLRLVFVSPCRVSPVGRPLDISEGPLANTALYIVNADGSGLVALPTVPGGDSEPAWSPEGQRIAFTSLRDGPPLLYVLDLIDQSVRRLTEPSPDFAEARQPAWSPFGNQILFTKKRVETYQIWSITDSGQGEQQIARGGQQYWDYSPTWSPDGHFVFYTERNATGPVLPWIMGIDYEQRNSEEGSKLGLGPLPVEHPRISPDGKWILFEGKSPEENRDIFVTTISGDMRARITRDPGIDFDPVWRPAYLP